MLGFSRELSSLSLVESVSRSGLYRKGQLEESSSGGIGFIACRPKKTKLQQQHLFTSRYLLRTRTMSAATKSASALDNVVVKSPNDRRLYRVIELENGLCALLIHDPDIYPEGSVPDQIDEDDEEGEEEEEDSDGSDDEDDEEGEEDDEEGEEDDEDVDDVKGKGDHQTKKAAAAMCVAMGSFLDPPEAQGLAHFLEHMLFMGSTEFPDENEYDSYLSKHGGSSNAYTEMEHTCYHFEVKREFLRGALKRFSQFFVAPLMKTEAMEREVLAIDSEFNQALQNDACRLQQLQCCTSAKGHPFNRFAWGNKKSLSGAMENGVDLRECIVKLYEKYYHGGLMKLVVIGGESLDMLESWVVELFNDVKNGSQIRPTLEAEGPIWKGGKSYRLEAVRDVHILDLTWTLPPLRHAYVKKPEDYLAHLLGHEGRGSLHSFLKSKGWATSLSAGVGDDGINRSSLAYVFGMSIHLTDSGLEKIYDIIGYIYQYLKLLRYVSPQEWIFKELQDIGNMDFRFPKEQPADDYAAELSENMLAYPVKHVIYGDYVYQTWDPKLIEDLMGFFTPKNMRIDVVSKFTKSEEFQHEPWFGSRYIEENVPLSLMETWSNPSEVDKSLHLPSKNQFIPCDFSIRAINSDGDPKSQSPPKCVIDDSDEKLSVLNDLSLNDLNSFIPELRSQALCHGNLSEDEAVNISNIYKNSLIVEPLPSKCRHGEQITCFPLSAKLVRDANVKNKSETNSVVEHYYQIQPEEAESTRMKAVLDLFHEIIEEPLFNQLRTKEQLGCVQSSEYGPVHLLERVDDFIKDIEGPVIQPLLHASDLSYSLEDCLKFLLEASRTDSGRSDLASRSILLCILRLLQLLPYPSSRHYLNLSLKVLRNLCAGDVSNQNSFVDHDGSVLISDLLDSAIAEKVTDFETVRFGLQVLANVVLFGEKRQRDVWLRFFPERFLSIAKIRRQETCDPLCMILYACFDGSSEIASQLCSNEGLTIIVETLRTSSSVGSVEDYWLKLLVSRICVEDDFFPQLVSKLAPWDGKNETFTSEQAFLLRMFSDIANERIGQVSISKVATQSVLNLFKQSVGVFDFLSGERSELPTGSTIIDVMGYSLVIIRDACAGGSLEELKKDNKDSGDTVELLLYSGIIELLLDLLRKLEPPTTIKKAQNQNPTSSSSSLKPCPYRGFRRDIVSVIGNCVYRRKEVQDEIRERDGLFLMLQQCVTDDENPFLREWGLFCVRNLLEGNPENQKAVAELEVQGSVDVPQLREIGLRVEIDPKTARPKLVNDK